MKSKIFIILILCFLSACIIKAQYSQSTTPDFNTNINLNISTQNNELKLTPDLGTGADGDLYIAPGTTAYTDAVKTFITGSNPSGQNALQVSSSAGFNVGDEVLLITIQDNNTDLNTNIAGQYEFKRILSKLSTALIFTENLSCTYDTAGKKHQVLKVPNYNNVTLDYGGILTCADWDESIGGIICFRAKGIVQIGALAKIDASLKGYIGGQSLISYGYGDRSDGFQGNGIFGAGVKNIANNGNAGGGGKRCTSGVWDGGGSGGGGGNGFSGGDGTGDCATAIGGFIVGSQFLTKLYLGGGGGSGANGTFYGPFGTSGKGGEGGGIIYFSCDSIHLLGQISSNGEKGGDAVGATYALGGGGGGAGGSIYIISNRAVSTGNYFISALGGMSGTGIQAGTGGSGGDGRIRIDAPEVTGASAPPVGYNGILYAFSGSSTTQPLTKSSTQCWHLLTYNKNTTAPGTSVIVDVLSNSNLLLQANVNSGSILTVTNDTIKLKISLINNFGNQTPVFYDWMLMLATAPPAIITPAGATTFCQGNSVTLNANTGIGYTYQWFINGTIISGAINSSYSATQGGSYTVVVTSGCSATSLPVIVTVNPLPNANAGNDQTICAGDSVTLIATGGELYQWDNGVSQGVSFIPTTTTVYTVIVTDTNGCTAIDNTLVTVNPIPPTPVISQNANVISSTSSIGNQWYLDNEIIPGAVNQNLIVVSNGKYYVIVTIDGCSSDTSNIIHFTTGTEDSGFVFKLLIYPNPNSGELNISCDIGTRKEVSFKVSDFLGNCLYYDKPEKYDGIIIKSIKLPALSSGIYQLIVTIDNERITKNFVITK